MASQGWEISSTWTADDAAESSLGDYVTVRDIHSSDGTRVVENARICLVPGPEKQSCEVTVRFQQQQHAIHHIDVLSTARTCEVYRQNEGDTDAEYLCTARGQLETAKEIVPLGEEKPTKLLYRAEMDLEDPEFCTSVTIRLLSLQDKSHVIIAHVLILVSPGPLLAPNIPAPAQAAGASGASLGALAPLMLQMAQGFSIPDMRNTLSERAQPHEELAMRALSLQPEPSLVETHSSAPHPKSEALLEDVCQRLERLESVCTRIESSLCKTLEAFDERLRILEIGVDDKPSGT